MSSSKQKPLQPPHALPAQRSSLELHSIISARSLSYFRASSGEEEEKKVASGLSRERTSLSGLRARTPRLILFPFRRLDVRRIGEGTLFRTDRSSTPPDASGQNRQCLNFLVPPGQLSASKSQKVTCEMHYRRPSGALRGGSRT